MSLVIVFSEFFLLLIAAFPSKILRALTILLGRALTILLGKAAINNKPPLEAGVGETSTCQPVQ